MQDQGGNPFEAAMQQYRAGRPAQAEASFRKLLKKPEYAAAAVQALAMLLMETGRYTQAVFELERVLARHASQVDILMTLHVAYAGSGQAEKALAIAHQALELAPGSDEIMRAIAMLHVSQFRLGEAEEWFGRARGANPGNEQVITGLAALYSASLRGEKTVELLKEAIAGGLRGLELLRLLAFRLQYVAGVEAGELFEAHRVAGAFLARGVDGKPPRLQVDADPERPLTIGLLSPDFRQHACAHFIEPLLEARNRASLRVIAYSNVLHPDATTARLRRLTDAWRDTATVQDAALSEQIAADKVDIAIDLAGHTAGSRLAALVLRPAPITATFIGYPNTTGVPGMDSRFVDSITDPPGAEEFATERLVRLDPCFLCYRPAIEAPEVAPPPFELAGHMTFGSFNILDKVSRASLDSWAGILKRVPGSRLVLKSRAVAAEAAIVERINAAFESRGVSGERVELIGSTKGIREHLGLYGRVDVALDTIPYNGTTTTCEALWMGVPVVVLRGGVHAARVGASLLSAAGLPELIAEDQESYITTAAELAGQPERLKHLRTTLRARVAESPLRDEKGYAARFEIAARTLWRSWCQSRR